MNDSQKYILSKLSKDNEDIFNGNVATIEKLDEAQLNRLDNYLKTIQGEPLNHYKIESINLLEDNHFEVKVVIKMAFG